MVRTLVRSALVLLGPTLLAGSVADAQSLRSLSADSSQNNESPTICRTEVAAPSALPPAASGPVVYLFALCPEAPTNVALETYLTDIQLRVSQPSQGSWVPYDAATERVILEDFQRLRNNRALEVLSVDVRDYTFSNGVVGKLVSYRFRERG